jgi:hypothetical protein
MDVLGEVLLLDLIQLRGARSHHVIGWRDKGVPARGTVRQSAKQYHQTALVL